MEIILTNKHGKHNYKQKYDLKMRRCPDLNQGSPVYYTGALTAKPQNHFQKLDTFWKTNRVNIIINKEWFENHALPGFEATAPKYDLKRTHWPGFEPGTSCLLDRRIYLYAKAPLERQWMEIILTNKPGKHNYQTKVWFKMRHCP